MLEDSLSANRQRFYGLYRGTVLNNVDPLLRGRLQVEVPDISPTPSVWAEPCTPYCGPNAGPPAVPPIGAGVWIEFEQGNPDYPVWVGCRPAL